MSKEKKPKKPRANKYEEKLKVKGSFDNLLDALIKPPKEAKKTK